MPTIHEQTHPNLSPLAGDDRRLIYSNWAVRIQVGLELADCFGRENSLSPAANSVSSEKNSESLPQAQKKNRPRGTQ